MSVSPAAFGASKAPAGRDQKQQPARLPAPQPHPALARIALLAAGLGLGITTALTFTAESASQLSAPGGLATFVGSLTGMTGTYLALIMVLLVSRIPAIERVGGPGRPGPAGTGRSRRGRSACWPRTRCSSPWATRRPPGLGSGTRRACW